MLYLIIVRRQTQDQVPTASGPGLSTEVSDDSPSQSFGVADTAAVENRSHSDLPHEPSDEGSTVRARFPQSQEDADESLSIRLILPNNATLPVNIQHNVTLGEIRR